MVALDAEILFPSPAPMIEFSADHSILFPAVVPPPSTEEFLSSGTLFLSPTISPPGMRSSFFSPSLMICSLFSPHNRRSTRVESCLAGPVGIMICCCARVYKAPALKVRKTMSNQIFVKLVVIGFFCFRIKRYTFYYT